MTACEDMFEIMLAHLSATIADFVADSVVYSETEEESMKYMDAASALNSEFKRMLKDRTKLIAECKKHEREGTKPDQIRLTAIMSDKEVASLLRHAKAIRYY